MEIMEYRGTGWIGAFGEHGILRAWAEAVEGCAREVSRVPRLAMYFEGGWRAATLGKLPTLRFGNSLCLLYSSPRDAALFVVSGSETVDLRSSCTERNSSPDNSAICDGLAARQEAVSRWTTNRKLLRLAQI